MDGQTNADKKRDKQERKILDTQERAFWDVHRPCPGCVNTTELDIKKVCRMNKFNPTSTSASKSAVDNLRYKLYNCHIY